MDAVKTIERGRETLRTSRYLSILMGAVVCITVGTFLIGWGATPSRGVVRPEKRIGDQTPGDPAPFRAAAWTPKRDKNGSSVTMNLLPDDPRIDQFADFPVHYPTFLPDGSYIEKVILYWNPETGKRLVQISIVGTGSALISQYRLQRRDPDYPKGIVLTSINQTNGTTCRKLQSNVQGIAVSMVWNPKNTDDEIIKTFKSLWPHSTPKTTP
jgi:hypothetical protein